MNKIPLKLGREPLIEAIWQVVVESPMLSGWGEIFLGSLYFNLKKTGGDWHVERLPASELPQRLMEQDPVLRYAAKYRLTNSQNSLS